MAKTSMKKRVTANIAQKNACDLKFTNEEFEKMFAIVDIEGISLNDPFMQYVPEEIAEARLKDSIIRAKEIGMKNFRIPTIDPSLTEDGKSIIYCAGKKPAVGKTPIWWEENAFKFMPEKNSKMCDDIEYGVVLGVMHIKDLVDNGCEVRKAWKKICVDTINTIGVEESNFELTGSRPVGKFYDLSNTYKIVKKRGTSLYTIFGGHHNCLNFDFPLAIADDITVADYIKSNYDFRNSIGVIRLDV